MADNFSIAITTVSNNAKARELATAALEARLAACVQLFPIESHYVWEGEVRQDEEIALHFKTRSEDYPALSALIRSLHDYEVPEILRIDIAEGDSAYLEWLSESVKK